MTIVGKILVFVNLVFSLVVGAFGVLAYAARTNYAQGVQDRDKVIQVYKSSNQALEERAQALQTDAANKQAQADARVRQLEGERDAQAERSKTLAAEVDSLRRQAT